ncbi:MAG: hypothetical protein P4L79_07875 [Legionella sp.]|uniref:hypothetical protein n=1 Tax=Legionella sp. TaxID=459 RepID=UPI0028441F5F|nr:hypothetical protein [Legionella sp.]
MIPEATLAPEQKQNFPVLDETITDVGSSTAKYVLKTHLNTTLIILMFMVVWILAGIYLSISVSSPDVLVWTFIIAAIGLLIYWSAIHNRIAHEFYQQFAQANNFQYQKNGNLELSGALFSLGHNRATEDIISGTYDGNPLCLFNYTYVIGGGKNQQTYHDTVFQIEYPSVLAPILLVVDSQYFGGITGLFSGWEKIKPEGDFDKNFDLYTKKEFEIEALQVFAPDFMQKMLAEWPEFNLEFNGNKLIIFHNHKITTKAELQKMYALTQFLITKIEPQAKGMEGSVKALEALQNSQK